VRRRVIPAVLLTVPGEESVEHAEIRCHVLLPCHLQLEVTLAHHASVALRRGRVIR